MKDYYRILGVNKKSTDEEIRANYRKLAMKYHPDRNADDPAAEERFKEIAEAYGVLTDPVKRKQYNSFRGREKSYDQNSTGNGFSYSQEDILKDLFKDPRFQHLFSGLLKEFQRSGFRHSATFVKRSFFGSKKGIFLGGIVFMGSLARPLLKTAAKKSITDQNSPVRKIGQKLTNLLSGSKLKKEQSQQDISSCHLKDLDITYYTPLSRQEMEQGKTIQILVYGEQGEQTLKVKIPPGSKSGQKLRIKGKGRLAPAGISSVRGCSERGDLFLQLECK
ncbi:MAG: hypothetical protein CSA26_01500 [Desulfobacterales bacterium]|nr:MAG: hypothetical protein CSA26_01500 [Desulfobacterales bacterium]